MSSGGVSSTNRGDIVDIGRGNGNLSTKWGVFVDKWGKKWGLSTNRGGFVDG